MNRFFRFLFLILVLSQYVFLSRAQESNVVVVQISKEKTVINGKTFYMHTVKKGENIYRISKAYGVTQKEIVIANPETISGIVKEGQILKIPIESNAPHSIQQIESDNFIYHITEEQQTVFSLSQKYKVSIETLVKFNPELEYSGLQIDVGQVIRIPKLENAPEVAETFSPIENYTEHKVRRKETKFSISQYYDITVDELIAANPILNTEDLKTGSIIRIPQKSKIVINTQSLLDVSDSIVKNNTTDIVPDSIVATFKPINSVLNIALLLPLSIEDNETRAKLDSAAAANNPSKIIHTELITRTVYSLEFYNGFLVAVDSLKKLGISVKIHVFDTGKEIAKVKKILEKKVMLEMDLIIGPFFQEGLTLANEFSLKNRILLVSPVVSINASMSSNPYAFQYLPDDNTSIRAMVNYIYTLPKKNIIFITSNDVQDTTICNIFKGELDINFPNAYKTVKQSKINDLPKYYSDSSDNIIIVPSTNEASMFTVFSKLNLDAKLYPIKVYGLPDCSRFFNIDQLYFHTLDFHFYTPFNIDYSNSSVQRFISLYRRLYKSEPLDYPKEGFNFGMLGFDLGNYYIKLLSQGSENLNSIVLDSTLTTPIHMVIKFKKEAPNSSYTNQGVQIMHFTSDFYIKKVD